MSKEIEISKVVLKIGDSSIELPIEEARQLQRALADLFGLPDQTKIVHVYEHEYRYPYPWRVWGTWTWNTNKNGNAPILSNTSGYARLLR